MRITELQQAASVAQTDDLAIDVPGGRTYRVPRSILAPAPYIATIPTGQWSGSGSDRYITVTASNVTADAILYPFYDNASAALLNGPVWAIPAAGSFTIHTSAIPSGTVTISVLLAGIVGEAQYQVLADVYSKSQVDSIVSQSTANMFKAKYWMYEPSTGATAGTLVDMATKDDLGLTGKTIRGIAVEEVYGGSNVDYNAKVIYNARRQTFVLMPSITQTPIRVHFTVFYTD